MSHLRRALALLALLCLPLASAQIPLDFAVGHRFDLGGSGGWHGGVRANLELGPEIMGQQAFVLPELGISTETLHPYVRVQLLLDGDYATTALDCRATEAAQYCSIELRFSY